MVKRQLNKDGLRIITKKKGDSIMDNRKEIIIRCVVFVLIALISLFFVAPKMSSTEFHAENIKTLDEKQDTVLKLTAAAAGASTIITLIPGDAGTPIADKLADFGGYFLIVLSAILLEKYLLTITGLVAFKYLIPIACGLLLIQTFWRKGNIGKIGGKIIILALAMSLAIPASIKVSDMIEDTYQSSINNSLVNAQDVTYEGEDEPNTSVSEPENTTIFGKIKDSFTETVANVGNSATEALEKAETYLNNMIEALAVMIVTNCLIPILVIAFFLWVCKIVLSVDIQ